MDYLEPYKDYLPAFLFPPKPRDESRDTLVYTEVHVESGRSFDIFKFPEDEIQANAAKVEEINAKNPDIPEQVVCHRKAEINESKAQSYKKRITSFFRQVFLPEGFPNSVSDDYVAYQTYDTIQAFASSISGSLATQSVLKGVGVGDENATAMAATITWLLRHGAGMMGQIMFTYAQGSDLDHNCKKWRLFADVMNDCAMLIELSAPVWSPKAYQLVLCTAGVFRSLVGVAGGATRAAITQHQARQNNISDVAAKDGSQETLVNLAALLVNLIILPLIGENVVHVWVLFTFMTCIHLFANYKAVKSLKFETLNRERFLHVLREVFYASDMISVQEANERESVFLGLGLNERSILGKRIRFGSSFEKAMEKYGQDEALIRNLVHKIQDEKYVAFVHKEVVDFVEEPMVYVLFSKGVSKQEEFNAFLDAALVARFGENHTKSSHDIIRQLNNAGFRTEFIQASTLGYYGDFGGHRKQD